MKPSITLKVLLGLLCAVTVTIPTVALAGIRQTGFDFESPRESWWFAGGAGLDYGKGLEHSGKGNGWVRNTSGWNAVNNCVNVEPNSECTVAAWLRKSNTLTDGYMSVRRLNRDGSVGTVINEVKLVGAGSPNPQNRGYNRYTFNFNSGSNSKVLFYVGLWGNGKDSWVQVDDVVVSCPTPF
ncbi:hypothetical protein [Leptolyngbya sp. FACHB-17]|uniref:hypothetical protein n=1 Tax=unclassified Leptolyngbya TaxID=2650499 RepID=UPI001680D8F0|nr:hypothetical protein [Leptolyngbya sp. FACHB-17]MBD2080730.1 hypothetical protein [Leptolyngbya sp. FACHB-17]